MFPQDAFCGTTLAHCPDCCCCILICPLTLAMHQVAPAQVMLRWGIQRGVSVVPKSTKSERLRQNLDVASFNLDDDDMQAIAKLDQGRRYNDPGVFAEGMGAFLPIYD
eukprot:scaffold152298_cov29-Tisochrysis_lutea.AAC.1